MHAPPFSASLEREGPPPPHRAQTRVRPVHGSTPGTPRARSPILGFARTGGPPRRREAALRATTGIRRHGLAPPEDGKKTGREPGLAAPGSSHRRLGPSCRDLPAGCRPSRRTAPRSARPCHPPGPHQGAPGGASAQGCPHGHTHAPPPYSDSCHPPVSGAHPPRVGAPPAPSPLGAHPRETAAQPPPLGADPPPGGPPRTRTAVRDPRRRAPYPQRSARAAPGPQRGTELSAAASAAGVGTGAGRHTLTPTP